MPALEPNIAIARNTNRREILAATDQHDRAAILVAFREAADDVDGLLETVTHWKTAWSEQQRAHTETTRQLRQAEQDVRSLRQDSQDRANACAKLTDQVNQLSADVQALGQRLVSARKLIAAHLVREELNPPDQRRYDSVMDE